MKFNQAQLTSAVKAGANFVAGILTTHGAAKAASIVNAEDTIGVLVFIAVWVYSHFFQHTDEKEATPTPLPESKGGGVLPPVVGLILVCAGLIGLLQLGCAGQNKRLEVGGAYNPATSITLTNDAGIALTNLVSNGGGDFKLYAADAAFDFAYSTLGAAFKIERDNRQFLWKISPTIKHSLDAIRPKAQEAVKVYVAARLKYLAAPVPANATDLDVALAAMQQLSDAAAAATAQIDIPSK